MNLPLNTPPDSITPDRLADGRCPTARPICASCASRTTHAASAAAHVSHFRGSSGVSELHLVVRPTEYGDFATQLAWVEAAYRQALDAAGIDPGTGLLRRFFCSDLVNQGPILGAHPFSDPSGAQDPCAVSWLRLPPAPPAKVVLWAYHVSDPSGPLRKTRENATLVCQRNGLAHHWTTGLTGAPGTASPGSRFAVRGAYQQTHDALARYDSDLRTHGMSWPTNVLRTWLFVHNIGANYAGVVDARREFYQTRGLTPQTHFIASTGVEGDGIDPSALLTFDAYAIRGVRQDQIAYLSAPDHLRPSHLYGVTFERGVAVAYRDRRHVMISGTASIDPQGRIVHPGDVARQTDRTMDNVEALLRTAGAELGDLGVLVAYVRDGADQAFVTQRLRDRCGPVPLAVVVTPICRPGWLVEVEGTTVVPADEPGLPTF